MRSPFGRDIVIQTRTTKPTRMQSLRAAGRVVTALRCRWRLNPASCIGLASKILPNGHPGQRGAATSLSAASFDRCKQPEHCGSLGGRGKFVLTDGRIGSESASIRASVQEYTDEHDREIKTRGVEWQGSSWTFW